MPLILAVRNSPGSATPPVAPLRIERGEVVVGRGAGSHLLLAGSSVSRRHCTITGEGQTWRLVDASTGGTFVNGQRLAAPHLLRAGDVIRVGETEIAVMLDAGSAPGAGMAMPAPAAGRDGWGRPAAGGSVAAATQVPAGWGAPGAAPTGAGVADAGSLLLQAAGLSRGQVGVPDAQLMAVAGAVLRASLSGLVRLAQDRRKAREDLGVATPGDAAELASAGSPEELLLRLLALPPAEAAAQTGALGAAIDTHQRATLGAMQDSLHHALDQFSPRSIKNNARGDAEAWKAYEQAFEAKDGFVELFAQALARRYGEAVAARH